MTSRPSISVLSILVGACALTLCRPPTPSVAKVEIVTGADVTADEDTVKEILATFDRAEKAIQAKDLDSLMGLYSKRYNYHRLRKSDARRIWEEICEYHHKLHSTHLFTKINKVVQANGEVTAQVTCTGALWGLADETGNKVTIDSWFEEVHYLVKEDGAWRIIGNAGDAPETPRFGHAPHPLF
ncbi:MAG TPA: hypothetical protein VKP13_01605 [Nitrospira sp.]|nr:hypothetical protein [Nitrospira sp.]